VIILNQTPSQYDLALGLPRPLQRYDRIVAHMVLMDIPTLEAVIADIAEALRPGGVLVFSILHPAFFSRAIVDEGPNGERYRKVTGYLAHETRWIESFGRHHHHRPLSWYVDLLCRHGVTVTGLHEPRSLPAADVPEAPFPPCSRSPAGSKAPRRDPERRTLSAHARPEVVPKPAGGRRFPLLAL
jgi:SAM-dependent methyltransferase